MGYTRNFKNVLQTFLVGNFVSSSSTNLDFSDNTTNTIKNINGGVTNITQWLNMKDISLQNGPLTNGALTTTGWHLGTGTEVESIEDYTIELTRQFTVNSSSVNVTVQNDSSVNVEIIATITPQEDVNITEIGNTTMIRYSASNAYVLLFRKLLDSPIHLQTSIPTAIHIEFNIPNPLTQ